MVGFDPPPSALEPQMEIVPDGWGDDEEYTEEEFEAAMLDYAPEWSDGDGRDYDEEGSVATMLDYTPERDDSEDEGYEDEESEGVMIDYTPEREEDDESDLDDGERGDEFIGEAAIRRYAAEHVWDDEGEPDMRVPQEAGMTDMMVDFILNDEVDEDVSSRRLTPGIIMDHDYDDDEDFNRFISSRVSVFEEVLDWSDKESWETKSSDEMTASRVVFGEDLDHDGDSFMREDGMRSLAGEMVEVALDKMFIESFAEEVKKLVTYRQMDDEVCMITPYVIHLPKDDQQTNQCQEIKPMTIVLTENLSNLTLDEPDKKCPVVIELPPKEPPNPKVVPWEYPGSKIGNVTHSGRCYASNANEKGNVGASSAQYFDADKTSF